MNRISKIEKQISQLQLELKQIKEQTNSEVIWTNRFGGELTIHDMEPQYIANCIKLLDAMKDKQKFRPKLINALKKLDYDLSDFDEQF
jgi:hypothetical protein